MSKKTKSLSQEDLIQIIEKKLQQPDLPGREFVALTKRLANLKGFMKQGEYHRAPAQQEQPQEPELLPSWWSDLWARVFISERARGIVGGWGRWHRELDQFEAEWAKQEGLSVDQLRDQLRREDAEWKAQHSPEERLAMAREHLESLRHPDSGGTPSSL